MSRWESIAEQFDGIEDIGLKAILRNDVVWKWSVDQGKDRQQFIDVAAESSSQLGVGDQFAWFNHLWKTYQGRFSGNVFEGTEPSGESVMFGNLTLKNAGRLSARAARDLAEIEPVKLQEAAKKSESIESRSSAVAVEALMGTESREVLNIANSDKPVDTKMRDICGVDLRFLGYNSERWSELVGVTSAAIRQTYFWKVDRRKAIEASQSMGGD